MPEVLFDEEFRYQILNQANLQVWFWADAWLAMGIYTAGNGISNKNQNRAFLSSTTTGKLWYRSGGWTVNRSVTEDGLIEISGTGFTNATDNGVAAEFILFNNFPQTDAACIAGTIGEVGSGADMIMNDTTITSGSPYRVMNWRVRFFQDFTY